MLRYVLLAIAMLSAIGCVSNQGERGRASGCDFLGETGPGTALPFDARLHEKRISQDLAACYLEGLAPSRVVAEQQSEFFVSLFDGSCSRSIVSREVVPAQRGDLTGYGFTVAVSKVSSANGCQASPETTGPGAAASVNITSKNANPPRYPHKAVSKGEEGVVTLVVYVDANGEARAVIVETSSGSAELDAAAVEGVARWQFFPSMNPTHPAWSLVRIPVQFKLN